MVFELPSLALQTVFDVAVPNLAVPGALVAGDSGALFLVDGGVKPQHRLTRFRQPTGLLGIQFEPEVTSVRLTFSFIVDKTSDRAWLRAHPDAAIDLPRALSVAVRGAVRAAVFVAPAPNGDAVRQFVSLDLTGEDLVDGVVVLGFAGLDPVLDDCLSESLTGALVERITVDEVAGTLAPSVSTGRAKERAVGRFLVTPGSTSTVSVLLTPVSVAEPASRRRLLQGRRAAEPQVTPPVVVAKDLAGVDVPVRVEAADQGCSRVTLDRFDGPTLVTLGSTEDQFSVSLTP